jgi:nucleoside-diphosphate-sugar epimerase
MNVFVTGATGTLGEPVVRMLVSAGHHVRALSRSEFADAVLRELGAEPVRAVLFDSISLETAMVGADAVLHLASRIPGASRLGRREAWRETDRIRRDGTRNLVNAAISAKLQAFVYPSVVFLYPDSGADWLDARTKPEPAEYLASTLEAESEVARFASQGGRGISLRMAGFYGPESSQTQEMLNLARRGLAPVFGRDDALMPTIWVEDAARAVVAAMLEAPSGVFDVVDDQPLTRRDHRAILAQTVGRSSLWRIPDALTSFVLGVVSGTLTRSQRVSNERFKAVTSWKPEVKNAREGWARIASSLPTAQSVSSDQSGFSAWALAALVYLMLTGLLVGVWAQFAPRSFYDAFPGLGFAWVNVDGPYNEHLVRDVGGLNLALTVMAVLPLVTGRRSIARAFGLAFLVYQLPHLIYHVIHVGALPTTLDQILQTLTLALATLAPIALLEPARPSTRDSARAKRFT